MPMTWVSSKYVGSCYRWLVGLLVGAIGIGIGKASSFAQDAVANTTLDPTALTMITGFIVGLAICSVLLSLAGSGVNAVIVLFADGPADFQRKSSRAVQ